MYRKQYNSQSEPLSRLKTIKDILDICPALTESGLRAAIFYNQNNFEDKCVKRFGRKILIDADALNLWLEGAEA
jgi:hypothetical protein